MTGLCCILISIWFKPAIKNAKCSFSVWDVFDLSLCNKQTGIIIEKLSLYQIRGKTQYKF